MANRPEEEVQVETRIQNVMRTDKVTDNEARRQVMRTEADRKAFILKYFHVDMMDPMNYERVINAEHPVGKLGGADRIRTGDLRVANASLSQLSYCPVSAKPHGAMSIAHGVTA